MARRSARLSAAGAPQTFEVRVPASTANLGAGFDCFGLALQLHLTVRVTVLETANSPWHIRSRGEPGSDSLPSTAQENLIARAAQFAAQRCGLRLPPLRLAVNNGIPLAAGLGSSAAAIVAGIKLCSALHGSAVPDEVALALATELEGHPDNAAAALYGGFVVTTKAANGKVIALRKRWPPEIRVLVITPRATLATEHARAVLPTEVSRSDAVHNLQRAALFCAALEEGRHELLWEAMQDRLHQPYRGALIPGLADALATPRLPGLLGIALSGAGPSVIALATKNFSQVGEAIAAPFRRNRLEVAVRRISISEQGAETSYHVRDRAASRRGAGD